MAMSDAQTIGFLDRATDPGLGFTHCGLKALAPGKAGCDRRGQRAAGAMGVHRGDTRRSQRNPAARVEQIVDAVTALPVAALDQHSGTAHGEQLSSLAFDRSLVLRLRLSQ